MLRIALPRLPARAGASFRRAMSTQLSSTVSQISSIPVPQRIAKYLAACGAAPSRRAAERLISEGRVAVNGVLVVSPAITIATGVGGDAVHVTLDRAPVDHTASQSTSVFVMHKLAGEIVSTNEPGRRTVFDRLRMMGLPEGLKAVGRLDMASEGLLLLTNNSALKRYLEHPSAAIQRVYRLRVYGHLFNEFAAALRRGAVVDGVRCVTYLTSEARCVTYLTSEARCVCDRHGRQSCYRVQSRSPVN
jgi:16S rRNA U516 pseudouridylate synthase RsuA-like enzyme